VFNPQHHKTNKAHRILSGQRKSRSYLCNMKMFKTESAFFRTSGMLFSEFVLKCCSMHVNLAYIRMESLKSGLLCLGQGLGSRVSCLVLKVAMLGDGAAFKRPGIGGGPWVMIGFHSPVCLSATHSEVLHRAEPMKVPYP
jgi:hypothetical protein